MVYWVPILGKIVNFPSVSMRLLNLWLSSFQMKNKTYVYIFYQTLYFQHMTFLLRNAAQLKQIPGVFFITKISRYAESQWLMVLL